MGIEDRFSYDEFRPGQRELAQRVYAACLGGETLIAEAMSGFGKTSAVLAGALTAAEETGCKVVYTCRTKRQINRVVEEIGRLQKKHRFNAASILSKYDYCLLRRRRAVPPESFGWYCSFNTSNNLCSYFLNVPLSEDFGRLVEDSLATAPKHSDLIRASEAIHVCPYEVARLAVAQASVAVVPYHYAFDTRAAPLLFDRGSIERRRSVLVVDEAHNLREFFRGLTSVALTLEQMRGAEREAKAMLMEDAARSVSALRTALEQAMAERAGWMLDRASVLERFRDEHGTAWLQNLAFELNASSGAAWGSIMLERKLPSLILKVGEFLARLSSSDQAVLVKSDDALGLVDPDPVKGTAGYLAEFRSAVLLSATANPASLFARSIGLGRSVVRSYEAPTAPLVIVKTAIDTGTSTRYKLRTPEMFRRISERVAAVIRSTPGGVGVFLPSYSVLGPVFGMVSDLVQDRTMVSEVQGMSNDDATDAFERFRSREDGVIFGVQGGRFSEGEDFEGGGMDSVAVVGMALPPPSPMLYAEFACLKRTGEPESYLMVSRLPALRRAFQAAGRHVRSPGKRGLVFFFDERFRGPQVRALMPSWLRRDLVVEDLTPGSIEGLGRGFWSRQI